MTVITSTARIERATCIAKHCRVYSSINVKIRKLLPSTVWSWTKSQLQTCRARVALCRTAVDSPTRRRLLCRLLTCNPSALRIRCTCLALMTFPLRLNSAAIRRYP